MTAAFSTGPHPVEACKGFGGRPRTRWGWTTRGRRLIGKPYPYPQALDGEMWSSASLGARCGLIPRAGKPSRLGSLSVSASGHERFGTASCSPFENNVSHGNVLCSKSERRRPFSAPARNPLVGLNGLILERQHRRRSRFEAMALRPTSYIYRQLSKG